MTAGQRRAALLVGPPGPARVAISDALDADGYAIVVQHPRRHGRAEEALGYAREAVAGAVGELGGLDLVIMVPGAPNGASLTADAWAGQLAGTATTTFAFAVATAPHLEARGGGLLNVAWRGNGGAADTAVHAAGVGLSKSMAIDLGPLGIRVNALSARHPSDSRVLQSLALGAVFLGGDRSGYITGGTLEFGGETVAPVLPAPSPADRGGVAVITGAGSPMGRAIASSLVRDGFAIAFWDVDPGALRRGCDTIESAGGRVIGRLVDIRDSSAVERAVAATTAQLGPLGVVVNLAGVISMGPMLEMSPREWDRILDVNLSGTYYTATACAESMVAAKVGGVIVNVGSVAGVRPMRNRIHYCASKAGVHGFTEGLGRELAPAGIRAVAIAPKGVISGTAAGWLSASDGTTVIDRGGWQADEEQRTYLLSTLPVGRHGQPEDVAELVSFLASSGADALSGVTIGIDGGYLAGDPVTR
jgi:NAD(P)-dependent dehydrogenase (short-subunit alcohol dehydrogenase family)